MVMEKEMMAITMETEVDTADHEDDSHSVEMIGGREIQAKIPLLNYSGGVLYIYFPDFTLLQLRQSI
jgi:hypothetical protein